MIHASIDVGGEKKGSEVALWQVPAIRQAMPELISVATYHRPEDLDIAGEVWIEFPDRIMPGVNPDDIFDLLAVSGGWYYMNWNAYKVKAAEWNRSLPKPLTHRRVWRVLNAKEKAVVSATLGRSPKYIHDKIVVACEIYATEGKVRRYGGQQADVLDAVGLGLVKIGRIR